MVNDFKKKINLFVIMFFSIVMFSSFGVFAEDDDVKKLEISLINQEDYPVYAGDVVEVVVGIKNNGYDVLDDVVLEVQDDYPFTILSDEKINLGRVFSGSDFVTTQIVKIKIDKDVRTGDYNLVFKELSGVLSVEHKVSISIQADNNIEVISIDENSLNPGEVKSFNFKIKNVGGTKLENVNFLWENSDKYLLPVNGDNSVFIESLDVGEEKYVKFDISASPVATSGLYKIDINLKYKDSKTNKETVENSNTGIFIGGGADFDIIFDESVGEEYAFTIANIGSNDASSVKISVNDNSNWKTIGKISEIIGNLNKGDYTTISFDFIKTEGNLNLIVEYTDTNGKRLSINKDVQVNKIYEFNSLENSSEVKVVKSTTNRRNPMGNLSNGINSAKTGVKYLGYGVLVVVLLLVLRVFYKKKFNSKKKF